MQLLRNCKDVKESIKDNTLEYIGIKESRKKGKIKPALRIMLGDPTKSINVVDVLNSDICRKYGVDGITLLLPSKSKCETREYAAELMRMEQEFMK